MKRGTQTGAENATKLSWPVSAIVAGGLLVVAAIVFRDFLFGNGLLLYNDSGSDSINDYYPSFVHLSDYLRLEGFPSWSFCLGMGQDLYYLAGYLILEPVSWLPRQMIAHALIFQHLAKLLLGGFFFFRFLELRGLNVAAALLGSFLLAFSAYMCAGACWYPFADEVVCFTAILFALELAIRRGTWHLVAWPVAAVGFIDAFHLYLCALFLVLYVPARLFLQHGWRLRLIFRGAMWLGLAACVGVGLGAFYTLPNLYFALNSPRGSGPSSMVNPLASFPIFKLESSLHYITAAVRIFGNDLVGTAEAFRGWGNYLEAPLTYCGIVCVVLLPQAFVRATFREKLVRGLFLGAVVITTLLPWSRYLFWLFHGDYYRTLSLFSILGIVSLSVVAFARYSDGKAISLWLLIATTAGAVGFLYLPLPELQQRLVPDLKNTTVIFLVIYAVLLVAGDLLKRRRPAAFMVILLTVIELALLDHRTVADRKFVTKADLAVRAGYNDATVDALHDIKAEDNTAFYRITKIRSSSPGVLPSLNDALVFGYYGTSYYSSFNNLNYIRFLMAVVAIPSNSEVETRYSVGLLNDSVLSLFAAEKY
ncbi:MAG: YfhO family protein, partial [Chthoniobacterales bacterium]